MIPSFTFLVAHPNPANHFVEYAQIFEEQEIPYQIIAEEKVAAKFSHLGSRLRVIDSSQLNEEIFLEKLVSSVHDKSMIIMDISSELWLKFYERLDFRKSELEKCVYYDNGETVVLGGYSKMASKVIPLAQVILFANASLTQKSLEEEPGVPIDLSNKEKFGIGYYPIEEVQRVLQIRESGQAENIRHCLFERYGIEDTGQKVFVYAGGANTEYYQRAFPHFIGLMKELLDNRESSLENSVFILQQHPRAREDGNLDEKEMLKIRKGIESGAFSSSFHFIVSDLSTVQCLSIAHGVFYHQTSMAAQFALARIPVVAQVSHEVYSDILIKSGFPFIENSQELSQILLKEDDIEEVSIQRVRDNLGMDLAWKENVIELVNRYLFRQQHLEGKEVEKANF